MYTSILPVTSLDYLQPILNLSGKPVRFCMDKMHGEAEIERRLDTNPVSFKAGQVAYALRERVVVKTVPASQVCNLKNLGKVVRIVAGPDESISLIDEPNMATVKLTGRALTVSTLSGKFMRMNLSAAGLTLHFTEDGFVEFYA